MNKRLDEVIGRINKMMEKPNAEPQTSLQMRGRAERLQQIRTGIKLRGGKVKKDYE